ncbi:MAG: hypothetical protein ACFFDF_20740 [Candidatus Odinarchaeota archaeon]
MTITATSGTGTQQLSLSSSTGAPSSGNGGTTDPSPGTYIYSQGDSVSVEALPNMDYRFSNWNGDVNNIDSFDKQITINLDKDKSLIAYFCTRCGDVNGDLKVTASDAQDAFDIFLGRLSNPTQCESENADVSCNNKITPGDAQAIFNKFLKKGDLPTDCSGKTRAQKATCLSIQTEELPITHLIVEDAQINSDGYVFVSIIVNNSMGIDAFGFDLQYPSEIFEFITHEVTAFLKDFIQVEANHLGNGVLRVGGYSTTPATIDSPEVLLTLVFRAKEEIHGPLLFLITNAYDDIKNAIVKNGIVSNQIEYEQNLIDSYKFEKKIR